MTEREVRAAALLAAATLYGPQLGGTPTAADLRYLVRQAETYFAPYIRDGMVQR